MRTLASLIGACLIVAACGGTHDAPGLAVTVQALELAEVGDVVWDVEVQNGAGQIVWQERVSASAFGDGRGSATFVGPCDADLPAHTIDVWVVGLYAAAVTDPGTFNAGLASGPGAVAGVPLPFADPTLVAPLRQSATCIADTNTPVRFDVTLARPAEQGFFDVAVAFDDIFCSAKLDCCADTNGDGCASDGSEDLRLLFDENDARGRTFALAFACTGGADAVTTLLMEPLTLDCTDSDTPPFVADVTIDVDGQGNLCTPGALASCEAIDAPALDPDALLFQVAAYRGVGDDGVAFWNAALGVEPASTSCRLRTRATAADASSALAGSGVMPPSVVYPYVVWDVALADCTMEPVSVAPDADVSVRYATSGGLTFEDRFGPGAATFIGPDIEALAGSQGAALVPVSFADTFVDPRGDGLTFALEGTLPSGVTFDPETAELSGTPSQIGTFTLSITARNAQPIAARSNPFTLTVQSGAPTFIGPDITTLTTLQHQPMTSFASAPRFSDPGARPLTYSLVGTAPAGVSLDTSSGVISGTPTASGSFANLRVRATNDLGLFAQSNAFTLTVTSGAPTFIGPSIATMTTLQHQPMSAFASAGRFSDPAGRTLTFSLVGTVPAGVSISGAGVISGTPTASGTFADVRVRATNDVSLFVESNTFTLSITSGAPSFIGPNIANVSGNQSVALTALATAARFSDPAGRPRTYSFVGAPPAGVSIASGTGVISGTPTGSGTWSALRVRATNDVGLSVDSNAFDIVIAAAPSGGQSYVSVGTFTFTVPAGVTAVSVVAIGGGGRGGYNGRNFVDATPSSFGAFLTANNGTNGGVGSGGSGGGGSGTGAVINVGGEGGDSGNNTPPGGGGGAAGYSGSGGAGGRGASTGSGWVGSSGAGGGGGGGHGGSGASTSASSGGGVGVNGVGASGGGGGGGGSGGESGTSAIGGKYGGGGGGAGTNRGGGGGGGLVYRNNIPVTPGQQIVVTVGRGASSDADGNGNPKGDDGCSGAVRIIWGPSATFP